MENNAILSEIAAAKFLLDAKQLTFNNDVLVTWRGNPVSSYTDRQLASTLELDTIALLQEQILNLEKMQIKRSLCVLSGDNALQTIIVPVEKTMPVALFGLGRIGRLLIRLAADGYSPILQIKCIVVRKGDWQARLSLILRDSVHGKEEIKAFIDDSGEVPILHYGSLSCFLIEADAPEDVNYQAYGLDNVLVIDNTGVYKDQASLGRHLQAAGASKVLLTAPGKGMPNIVNGINQDGITSQPSPSLVSAASCTTNATVPMLDLVDNNFGIRYCHFETIHSYTNDQVLVDSYHKSPRRSRAATENIVISSTGASSAVTQVLPGLAGKISGNAIRVPSPNVSLVIASITLEKEISLTEFYQALVEYSSEKPWLLGIDTNNSASSKDFVGDSRAVVIDYPACQVNGNHLTIYGWYDNEYGYANQVMRLACSWAISDNKPSQA